MYSRKCSRVLFQRCFFVHFSCPLAIALFPKPVSTFGRNALVADTWTIVLYSSFYHLFLHNASLIRFLATYIIIIGWMVAFLGLFAADHIQHLFQQITV